MGIKIVSFNSKFPTKHSDTTNSWKIIVIIKIQIFYATQCVVILLHLVLLFCIVNSYSLAVHSVQQTALTSQQPKNSHFWRLSALCSTVSIISLTQHCA